MSRGGGRRRGTQTFPATPVVSYIAITTVAPPNIAPSETLALNGYVESGGIPNAGGTGRVTLPGRTVTFATGNAAVATVTASAVTDATGQFSVTITGQGNGTTTITPSCEGVIDETISITVTTPQNAVASVVWQTPGDFNVTVGQTVAQQVRVKDAGGNVLTGKTVTWNSSTPANATVSADSGNESHQTTVTGIAAGTSVIKATCDGVDSTSYTATAVVATGGVGDLLNEDFDDGAFPAGWVLIDGAVVKDYPAIVADATAIGGNSLRMNWYATGDQAKGVAMPVPGAPRQKVHVLFRYKLPTGFSPWNIMKLIRFRGLNDKPIGTMNIQNATWLHWGDDFSDGQNHSAVGSTPADCENTWGWLEVMCDWSATTSYTFKIWFNNNLVLNYTRNNVNYSSGIYYVYLWSYMNTPGQQRTEYIDQVSLGTTFIGAPT